MPEGKRGQFKDRLRSALIHWGGGHRAFSREIEKVGVRGASYRSLVNYLKGHTKPSRKWMEEAAAILTVQFPWLRDGEGKMIEPKVILGTEIFRQSIPDELFEATHPVVSGAFMLVLDKLSRSFPNNERATLGESDWIELGQFVSEPVEALLVRIGQVNVPGGRDWRAENLALSMAGIYQGLTLMIPDTGRGIPRAALLKEWRAKRKQKRG